jgi:hypothetical protein
MTGGGIDLLSGGNEGARIPVFFREVFLHRGQDLRIRLAGDAIIH